MRTARVACNERQTSPSARAAVAFCSEVARARWKVAGLRPNSANLPHASGQVTPLPSLPPPPILSPGRDPRPPTTNKNTAMLYSSQVFFGRVCCPPGSSARSFFPPKKVLWRIPLLFFSMSSVRSSVYMDELVGRLNFSSCLGGMYARLQHTVTLLQVLNGLR